MVRRDNKQQVGLRSLAIIAASPLIFDQLMLETTNVGSEITD
jgi:hypothetical protein